MSHAQIVNFAFTAVIRCVHSLRSAPSCALHTVSHAHVSHALLVMHTGMIMNWHISAATASAGPDCIYHRPQPGLKLLAGQAACHGARLVVMAIALHCCRYSRSPLHRPQPHLVLEFQHKICRGDMLEGNVLVCRPRKQQRRLLHTCQSFVVLENLAVLTVKLQVEHTIICCYAATSCWLELGLFGLLLLLLQTLYIHLI